MSLQHKLKAAASAAASEAALRERGRCLWCLEFMLEGQIDRKLLETQKLVTEFAEELKSA